MSLSLSPYALIHTHTHTLTHAQSLEQSTMEVGFGVLDGKMKVGRHLAFVCRLYDRLISTG